MWKEETERFLKSVELRLALWFEEGRFFTPEPGQSDPHRYWICRKHLARLREMFYIAGVPLGSDAGDCDDSWLPSAVNRMRSCLPGSIPATPLGYFGETVQCHFLFAWLTGRIAALVAKGDECRTKHTCNTLTNHAACTRNQVFADLKAVHCKLLGNRGERIRFGMRRLHCLATAAARDASKVLPREVGELIVEAADMGHNFEAQAACAEDPSWMIAELIAEFEEMKALELVTISAKQSRSQLEVTVSIQLSRILVPGESKGGAGCGQLLERFESLKHFAQSNSLFREKLHVIAFVVKLNDDESISIQRAVMPAPQIS
jgi:hypothetical protein